MISGHIIRSGYEVECEHESQAGKRNERMITAVLRLGAVIFCAAAVLSAGALALGTLRQDDGLLIDAARAVNYRFELVSRDIASGIELPLTRINAHNIIQPTVSPDGRKVAFYCDCPSPDLEQARHPLWLYNITSGALRSVDLRAIDNAQLSSSTLLWSPDSRHLMLKMRLNELADNGADHMLLRVSVADGDAAQFGEPVPGMNFGSHIAYNPAGDTVRVINTTVDFIRAYDVTENSVSAVQSWVSYFDNVRVFPLLSPDLSAFIVGAQAEMNGRFSVYRYDFDSNEPSLIFERDGEDVYTLAWSPDGQRIAVMTVLATSDSTLPYRVYVMNSDGSDIQAQHTFDYKLLSVIRWSPDGSRLLTLSERRDRACIVSLDDDGVMCMNGFFIGPNWQPVT